MDHIAKLLRSIPPKHRAQVLDTIDCLYDVLCRKTLRVEKLAGSDLYKVRAGQYRVSFSINDQNQAIVRFVRLRNEKTYRDI